jgi:hypothetical protein
MGLKTTHLGELEQPADERRPLEDGWGAAGAQRPVVPRPAHGERGRQHGGEGHEDLDSHRRLEKRKERKARKRRERTSLLLFLRPSGLCF